MIYGIIVILLLFIVLIILLLKKLSKGKRIKVLKYGGFTIGIAFLILLVFNTGYYLGSEQTRQLVKGEQAIDLDFAERVFLEKKDPKGVMASMLSMKTLALISNIKYDNESFFNKVLVLNCFKILKYDDSIGNYAESRLIRLCANIEKYDIDQEKKDWICKFLDASIKQKYKDRIEDFIERKRVPF